MSNNEETDLSDLMEKPTAASIAEDANTAVPSTGPDVYGQYHPIETKAIMQEKQKEFTEELTKLQAPEGVLPDHATLWNDPSFRLLFLRCEVYHADRAAKRFVKYWERRLELFGNDSISIQSIDRVCLEMGYFRVVVPEDGVSRPYAFIDPSNLDKSRYTVPKMTKAVWFMLHSLFLENEVVSSKGLIALGYFANVTLSHFDRDLVKSVLGSLQGALPLRLSAMHGCNPPTIFRIIFPIVQAFMQPRLRRRLVIHVGNDVVDQLVSKYNFKKENLPTEFGGYLVVDATKWAEERERKDSARNRVSVEVEA